ncbi:hypothetical protein ACJMK2_005088 [Sinanodonta woodiana]|uniref:Uncharacterized protein n=1 Tax=Sinanodonta woodiana TaxID=1069815 RepID=A0ABD3VP00_SINWO
MWGETLQNNALCENTQGDRKRVLVAFLSDSVSLGTTVKYFLSLLHKFPNLEVVTLSDVYSHEQGILGSSPVAGFSDDISHQELEILGSARVDAVMLILTETIIDIWTSAADNHCQTKHIDNKQLKTLIALFHDLRRNDQVMTIAVNYDFLNEESLKLKTFRALNMGIQVFTIVSNSAQLGFQLKVDAIHQMLQYLCDSNYRSLLTWKESMDAELLLESIKKEEFVRCELNEARKRQCPLHGHLSEIDARHVNNVDLLCCERNEGYLFPRVVQVTQHAQKTEAGGSRVWHGSNSGTVHQVSSDVQSIGYSNVTTAFAKVHFDAKASSLHRQFCPSISSQSNIEKVDSEPTEADVVFLRHTRKEFDNEKIMMISSHSGNGMAIIKDISLKDTGLIMLDPNGGDSSLNGIFQDTRRKLADYKDDQGADSGVYSSYLEPDEAVLYSDIFIPPADLDEVNDETTVNALMEEIVLINKIDG